MNVTVCLSNSRLSFLTPFYISELPNYSKHMALEALNFLGLKGLAYLGSFFISNSFTESHTYQDNAPLCSIIKLPFETQGTPPSLPHSIAPVLLS